MVMLMKSSKSEGGKKNNELALVPLKKGAYEKPKRVNQNIPKVKYDKVDDACESTMIGNDGNIYIPEEKMPGILGKKNPETKYIVDNKVPDKDKVNVNNKNMINTAGVVGYLERNSHQTRDVDEADLNRYSRDSLIRIGDSDQAEAERRRIDTKVKKELPRLKHKRNVSFDEITGEPLEQNAAFHHKNNKAIDNNANDVINPDKGIVVNTDTHKEIHRRKIMDENQLEEQKEDIKETVLNKKSKETSYE